MDGRSAASFTYSRSEVFWISQRTGGVLNYFSPVERVETVVGMRVILDAELQAQPNQYPNEPQPYLGVANTAVLAEGLITLCDEDKNPRVQDLPANRAAWVSIALQSVFQRAPLVPLRLEPFRCNIGASYVRPIPAGSFKNFGVELFYL